MFPWNIFYNTVWTSSGSLHNQLLFIRFTFWSSFWSFFFIIWETKKFLGVSFNKRFVWIERFCFVTSNIIFLLRITYVLYWITLWTTLLRVLVRRETSRGNYRLFLGHFFTKLCTLRVLRLAVDVVYALASSSYFRTLTTKDRSAFRKGAICRSLRCSSKAMSTACFSLCWINLMSNIIYLKRKVKKNKEVRVLARGILK